MPSISRTIALRYLWSGRGDAFITVITLFAVVGVAVGVMVITIVMAIMTGFQTELREKLVSTDSHIVVRQSGANIDNWHEPVKLIALIPGVVSVSGFTYHQGLISTELGSMGLLLRGIEKGSAAAAQLDTVMEHGADAQVLFSDPDGSHASLAGSNSDSATSDADRTVSLATSPESRLPGIVIGRELQRSLRVRVGQAVSILSPALGSTPFGLVPRFRRFVVAGIYSSGLGGYEKGLAYLDLNEAQRFFRTGDAVSAIEVRVKDIDQAPSIAKLIIDRLGGVGSGYYAQDWTQTNKPLWDALQLEKRAYFVVLLLIVIIASFSIVSLLIMIVIQKRRDIAVLKTLGARNRMISNTFISVGAAVGALGTIVGTGLGLLGCFLLRKYGFPLPEGAFPMDTLPVRIEPLNFAFTAIAAFLICLLATIYPARRASRVDPVEALRME